MEVKRLNGITYGGLKYCSSTTYIPRNNSDMRKYFPALSIVLSLLSFHLTGFGSLKPGGGGPAGVALRNWEVEKVALDATGVNVRIVEAVKVVNGRLRATSIVMGFVVAIVKGCSWQDCWRSVTWIWYYLRVDGTLRLDFEMTLCDWPKVESFYCMPPLPFIFSKR